MYTLALFLDNGRRAAKSFKITPYFSSCAVSILAGPGGRVAGTQSRPDQGAAMMRGYGSVAVAEAAAVTVPP